MSEFAGAAKITVGQALKAEDSAEWVEAMRKEVFALLDGGTLIPTARDSIRGRYKILHSTAQLKKKLFQDGSIDKRKCRVCVCGNEL